MSDKLFKTILYVFIILIAGLVSHIVLLPFASAASLESLPPDLERSTAYYYRNFTAALNNGKTFEVFIPFVNPLYFDEIKKKYGKKNHSPFFFSVSASSSETILQSPFSADTIEIEDIPFNPYRKKAFDDLKQLYEICSDAKSGNFDKRYAKAAEKVYCGMLHNYANYPDICLAARLCLLDTIAAEYGSLFLSGSPFFFEYEQIKENYAHEPDYSRRLFRVSDEIDYGQDVKNRFKLMDANLKKLINSIEPRLAAIKANDGAVTAKIEEIKTENGLLLKTATEAYAKINSAAYTNDSIDEYCGAARKILVNHITLYEYYMEIGRYEDARSIFEPAVTSGRTEFKGAFIDTGLKLTGGGKKPVNDIKNMQVAKRLEGLYIETLYKMIFTYRLNETNRPARSEKDGGGPGLSTRVKACCEFIASDTRKFSAAIAGSSVSKNIRKMRKTPFGFAEKGFEKYFVSKPEMTHSIISFDEMRQNSSKIRDPFDVVTLRIIIDHKKNKAPYYSIESTMNSLSSNRHKKTVLKFEYFNGALFSKFQPNESREEDNQASSLIDISEGQRNPQPLPEFVQDEINDEIAAGIAVRKKLENEMQLSPYLKSDYKEKQAPVIDRPRLAAMFDKCLNEMASQAKTNYSVEIIFSNPRSLEAAYAVNFMTGRLQASAKILYKKLFMEHFSTLSEYENGLPGKIILAYLMTENINGAFIDKCESNYLSSIGKKTLEDISNKSHSSDFSALAHLFLANTSDRKESEKLYAKFIEKYPDHPAQPLVELKILERKAAWSGKKTYKAVLSELNKLSEKYKTVKIPFSEIPFSVEFDYCKIQILVQYDKFAEARKIFSGIKKYCSNITKFQEFIEAFGYMDRQTKPDKE